MSCQELLGYFKLMIEIHHDFETWYKYDIEYIENWSFI